MWRIIAGLQHLFVGVRFNQFFHKDCINVATKGFGYVKGVFFFHFC